MNNSVVNIIENLSQVEVMSVIGEIPCSFACLFVS